MSRLEKLAVVFIVLQAVSLVLTVVTLAMVLR